MVMNGLGFSSRALYLMMDFLRNKPVDLPINPELTAEDFNDDTLGRLQRAGRRFRGPTRRFRSLDNGGEGANF